jgi:hypothetical protein
MKTCGEWLPMETAPKDRQILIWAGERQCVGWWVTHVENGGDAWCMAYTPDGGVLLLNSPKMWRELPEGPRLAENQPPECPPNAREGG